MIWPLQRVTKTLKQNRATSATARVAVSLVLALALQPSATAQSANESQVKAAYLYNFMKFAEWPSQALPNDSSPLTIGIFGKDEDFFETLKKTVNNRTVGSHPISVTRVNSPEEMKSSALVFFEYSERKRTQEAIAGMGQASVLLVGEQDDFLQKGGMIALFMEDGKVRFQVDRDALNRASIRLSASLLALAKTTSEPSASASGRPRQLSNSPPPEYPEVAQKMNLTGTVQILAVVRRDGTVKETRVVGGHPLLAEALSKAVMKWKYAASAAETKETVKYAFGR